MAAVEETVITAPSPRATIAGRKRRVRSTGASHSRRTWCSSSSRSEACSGPPVANPALLTRMSTRRPASASRPGTAARAAGSVRSQATTSVRTPKRARRSPASPCSRSSRRARSVTPWPASASWRANSAPRPDDAPVTSAVPAGSGAGKPIRRAAAAPGRGGGSRASAGATRSGRPPSPRDLQPSPPSRSRRFAICSAWLTCCSWSSTASACSFAASSRTPDSRSCALRAASVGASAASSRACSAQSSAARSRERAASARSRPASAYSSGRSSATSALPIAVGPGAHQHDGTSHLARGGVARHARHDGDLADDRSPPAVDGRELDVLAAAPVERAAQRGNQLLRGQPDVQREEVGPERIVAAQAPQFLGAPVPDLDALLRVDDRDAQLERGEDGLQEVVDVVELVRPLAQLVVDRLELLVGGLELFVHRLELLVRRLELLVGGLELVDRRLELLVGELEVAPVALELPFERGVARHVLEADQRAERRLLVGQQR